VLKKRAAEPELMDAAGFDRNLAEESFRFIAVVNRWFGDARAVRRFVAAEAARTPRDRALRVLDVGSGSCDIPIAVCAWARGRRIRVHFTCIENSEHAVRIARRNLRRNPDLPITLIRGDIFAHQPEALYDCAVGSMFFHHLAENDIMRLIDRLRGFVRSSLLINDLQRSPANYAACRLLLPAFPFEVGHDALLSIRKGFRAAELEDLLAGLQDAAVSVSSAPLFRIRAVVRFIGVAPCE
jgi:SAM-dependent methyltransferase